MRALVTGGTGFLGGALARRLHRNGIEVTALGRNLVIGKQLSQDGIRFLPIKLEDRQSILQACSGMNIVFHCGALSSPWGRAIDFYNANVLGTQHIVEGCVQASVPRLVHISTPSLYFFHESRLNVRESDALPAKPANLYVSTKRQAEQIIDEAAAKGLFIITFRPRGIYGPGDTALLPRIIVALEAQRLPIIGDGTNIGDFTYIDNLVDALELAMSVPDSLNNQKFNLTNGCPVPIWSMIAMVCDLLRLPRPTRKLSFPVAFQFATWLERIYRLLPGMPEPPLTRYTVGVLAHSQTLDISAARTQLGYVPAVSNDEGLERFTAWWKTQHG